MRSASSRSTELTLARLGPAAAALLRVVQRVGRGEGPVLVGGAVRDALLGRPVADLDVAVPAGALALAERVATALGATAVVLDAERGAARVAGPGRSSTSPTSGPPTSPVIWPPATSPSTRSACPLARPAGGGRAGIVDPTGGLADLRARRLRPAGPGVLADDPLRALRAVRLEATLGLRLTPAAARAVRAAAPGLTRVAAERVSDELVALLALPATGRALRRADRLGCSRSCSPRWQPMRRAPQPAPHRFGVLEHSLRAVEPSDRLLGAARRARALRRGAGRAPGERLGGALDRGRVLKLAALLHDVSKPETRRRGARPRTLLRARRDRAPAARGPSASVCGCPSGPSRSSSGWSVITCGPMHLARRGRSPAARATASIATSGRRHARPAPALARRCGRRDRRRPRFRSGGAPRSSAI